MMDKTDDHKVLARRVAWFEAYCERSGEGSRQAQARPKILGRYLCPCCHYPTLPSRAGEDICPLCDWQDDGQDDPHADEVWGGPNYGCSLSRARENFKCYWVMYHPDNDRRVCGPDSEKERSAKRAACAAFDQMMNDSEATLEKLMPIVEASFAVIRAEKKRKIEAYSTRRKAETIGSDR